MGAPTIVQSMTHGDPFHCMVHDPWGPLPSYGPWPMGAPTTVWSMTHGCPFHRMIHDPWGPLPPYGPWPMGAHSTVRSMAYGNPFYVSWIVRWCTTLFFPWPMGFCHHCCSHEPWKKVAEPCGLLSKELVHHLSVHYQLILSPVTNGNRDPFHIVRWTLFQFNNGPEQQTGDRISGPLSFLSFFSFAGICHLFKTPYSIQLSGLQGIFFCGSLPVDPFPLLPWAFCAVEPRTFKQ